jgi:S-adenosylmethionine-diacylglycerol 3-amino-3-carboxypropyl transferase
LGGYLDEPESWPEYLVARVPKYRFDFVESTAQQMSGWGSYDLVDLSNIFDWMPEEAVASLAIRLSENMRPGSRLIFRQLNHTKNFAVLFAEQFQFDVALGERLRQADRSLFYAKINIGTKM